MAPTPSCALRCASALALLASLAAGQWSDDPTLNVAVGDSASDQSQAKLAPTDDGGVWVSWFDGIASGWDVRVQKLDIGGAETLSHAGVLVADRGFSSTQDYGLDTDADGNALLAFRDDSGVGTQIAVNKILPDGSQPWGAGGIQVTSTGAFVAAPKVAGTSDGGAVVVWTEDSSVKLRKLNAAGTILPGTLTFTPGGGSYSVSDLHASGTDVIFAFIHQTGGFGSPRRILAQKIATTTGTLLWGAGHVEVFDTGSLQFGNFPSFTPDGAGGAVFSWYDTAGATIQSYVQHILANGTEAYPHNGVAVSTNVVRIRTSPSAQYDAASGETTAFWVEQNAAQSQSGVYGQRFDASGARLWTAEGLVLEALSADSNTQVEHITSSSQSVVVWNNAPSAGTDQLVAARVSSAGTLTQSGVSVSSTASDKSRLAMARTSSGTAALAWKDTRTDAGDIYSANLNEDGTLGPRWTDLGGGTTGINGAPRFSASGPLTAGSATALRMVNGPFSGASLLWISTTSVPFGFLGGTIHANPFQVQVVLVTSPSGELNLSGPLSAGLPSGFQVWFQFLLQDLTVLGDISLSNALRAEMP